MRGISLNPDKIASQNLSSAPLSFTVSYGKRYKLDEILIHFTQAIIETVTITLISGNGANYNTVLQMVTLQSESDFVFRPQGETNFQANDQIKVECTNANGVGTAYVNVKTSQLGSGG